MGFGSHQTTRVPLFNARHRDARLARAREHRDWSVEDWKRLAWSDESRFGLINNDGRLRIWCGRLKRWIVHAKSEHCARAWWLNHGMRSVFVALFGISGECINIPQCHSVRRVAG
ncbi:uncharacterized protein TNCV_4138421 [Trichonephila clavipes]|nr:uncharacterized protein TNCV_4138421 [Trichonephila clavipes]